MSVQEIGKNAKLAESKLRLASADEKTKALNTIADELCLKSDEILSANQKDLENASKLSSSMLDRLTLTVDRVKAMADGVREIAKLDDPVGKILASWDRPNGLKIKRQSVPIGVVAVIYESRPNVTADAAALCIKSGNAVILRGGSESFYSSQAIYKIIADCLKASVLPDACVQMLPSKDRKDIDELIKLDQYVDVLIPRGGKSLISYLSEHSKVPLFKHLEGLCHTYIHQDADFEKAVTVACNAKMRRTGICGATETILIDESIVSELLPKLNMALKDMGCEVVGDALSQEVDQGIMPATEEDWSTEYLSPKVSVKVVKNIDEAIAHIEKYGSQHTDAIITENQEAAKQFFDSVDSAIVMQNASTQFADGGEFGMGAEIGIATGKLHARGPVGVEQLTTFKYIVVGDGQIRPA